METSSLDESQGESGNAINVEPQPTSPILKLDVDCFEELYEWLSLADLFALRRTCKRLRQVVDYAIRSNYPALKMGRGKIELQEHEFGKFHHYDRTSIEKIKELSIYAYDLTKNEVDIFAGILPQIEKLHIGIIHTIVGELDDLILKWCSNLKCLSISYIASNKVIGEDNRWLLRRYPSIEHVIIDDNYFTNSTYGAETEEIKEFFELNPNIQIFSITFDFFWANRNHFLESNIKIDRLDVTGDSFMAQGMSNVCRVLNKLYEQGFYKRVHMYAKCVNGQDDIDWIATIRGLEKLYLPSHGIQRHLPVMPELKELAFASDDLSDNYEAFAKNLVNLERVYFECAHCDVMTPFLKFAPKLKKIKINILSGWTYFDNVIIDLVALNRERSSLTGANKVTIYVRENIFLMTKFALNKTELSLVSLKRAEAFEWIHQSS